jgi:hypothetical protein
MPVRRRDFDKMHVAEGALIACPQVLRLGGWSQIADSISEMANPIATSAPVLTFSTS